MNSKQFLKFFFIFLFIITLSSLTSKITIAINQTEALILSQNTYFEADAIIKDMQKKGYPTLPLIDLLTKSQEEFNTAKYFESINTSNEIKQKSIEIESLYKLLEKITISLKLMNQFGIDTTPQDLKLLYSKSDFEAANIETSRIEAESLDNEIFKIFSNISKQKFKDMETYRENLLINNINETFFEYYYITQKNLFNQREYSEFLENFSKFEALKIIIEQKQEFEQNLIKIKNQNISFERSKAALELFTIQINDSNYVGAKQTIGEINNLSKTALSLKLELLTFKTNYDSIRELGLLNNKTEENYAQIQKEYVLENFKEAERLLVETEKLIQEIEKNNMVFGGIRKAELKKSLYDFFINNWPYIVIIIILSIILFRPLKNYFNLHYLNIKIRRLKLEKEVILEMQKELQKNYYMDHAIDKKSYHKDFQRYEERKIELQNSVGVNEDKTKTLKEYFKKLKNKITLKK